MRASALVHSISILDLVQQNDSIRFSELKSAIGISEPTLSAILKLLLESNLLKKSHLGYSIGKRSLSLADQFLKNNLLTKTAQPFMQSLRQELKCRIELGEPQGCYYYVLNTISGPNDPDIHAVSGREIHHMIGTAPAKLCLAHLTSDEQKQYFDSPQFYHPTPNTLNDLTFINDHLKIAKRTGYIEDHEEARMNITRISAAIYNHQSEFIGCLSLVFITSELTRNYLSRCKKQLLKTSQSISLELGHSHS